jgi:hypothetical protein
MTDTCKVRALNDAFRQTFSGGRIVATVGIANRSDLPEIVSRVRRFTEFTEENDPYGEHDFGAFDHAGESFFWKIDYYGCQLSCGSEDPSNPDTTTRVLTIMLAEEY